MNFTCESSHPDTAVKWYKNGAELMADETHCRIHGDGQQCCLTIDAVALDDAGDYCCRMVGSDASTKATLTVKGQPLCARTAWLYTPACMGPAFTNPIRVRLLTCMAVRRVFVLNLLRPLLRLILVFGFCWPCLQWHD